MKQRYIDISSLTNEGCSFTLRFDAEDLELLDISDVVFTDEIQVESEALKQGGEIVVDGEIEAHVRMTCIRCLDEFDKVIECSFQIVEPIEDIINRKPHERGHSGIDIVPYIREELFLAVPEYPLCDIDCRGLCPHCGINRNESSCDCEKHEE